MSDRVTYAEAGAAIRQAIAAATAARLTGSQWRVLGAVFALTGAYSRLAARVYVDEIAKLADLRYDRASEAVNELHRLGVIVWTPVPGGRKASRVELPQPANPPQRREGFEDANPPQGRAGLEDANPPRPRGATPPGPGAQPPPGPGGGTRRTSRRSFEKSSMGRVDSDAADNEEPPDLSIYVRA